MCIAIVKTKNGKISEDTLRTCFKNNPHGAGLSWTQDGELYLIKGIFTDDELIRKYKEVEAVADNNILIHCRISTSGLIDIDNSHPHIVNKSTVLIHNGILDIVVPKDSKKSDTALFIEKYLKELPEDFVYNKAIMKLIEDKIGSSNKFVFLNSRGDYFILNESAGEWVDGVWYSNNSYKDYLSYSKYNEYDYDKLDEEYLQYYHMTRDELLDMYKTCTPNYKDIVKRAIKRLTLDDLDNLDSYPLFNIETEEFINSAFEPELNEFYLDELDEELLIAYEDMYYLDDYVYEEA